QLAVGKVGGCHADEVEDVVRLRVREVEVVVPLRLDDAQEVVVLEQVLGLRVRHVAQLLLAAGGGHAVSLIRSAMRMSRRSASSSSRASSSRKTAPRLWAARLARASVRSQSKLRPCDRGRSVSISM